MKKSNQNKARASEVWPVWLLLLVLLATSNASAAPILNFAIPDFVYHEPQLNLVPQKKFVIVVTSYNNAEWCTYNLGSIFEQQYDNYRVIYVDDCSDDGNAQLVEQFIAECGQKNRCTIIKNRTRKRALANFYYALQLCDDDEMSLIMMEMIGLPMILFLQVSTNCIKIRIYGSLLGSLPIGPQET